MIFYRYGYVRRPPWVRSSVFACAALLASDIGAATLQPTWTRTIDTDQYDSIDAVVVNHRGDVYVGGRTFGSLTETNVGGSDAYVAKFDRQGVNQWTIQWGDSGIDGVSSLALDGAGNIYVGGHTDGSLGGQNRGAFDALLTKIDRHGNELWSEQFGGRWWDFILSVTADEEGNAYVAGHTRRSFGRSPTGKIDAFVSKYSSEGEEVWTNFLASPADDYGSSVAIDGKGHVYVGGSTNGSLASDNQGLRDGFLAKYDSEGASLWVRQFGTEANDLVNSVVVDGSSSAYATGWTEGALNNNSRGGEDIFIAKHDSDGSNIWTQQSGTPQDDRSGAIAINEDGDVYVAGRTRGVFGTSNAGLTDAFVARADSHGVILEVTQTGAPGKDEGVALTIDDSGAVYLARQSQDPLSGLVIGDSRALLIKYVAVPEPTTASIAAMGATWLLVRRPE